MDFVFFVTQNKIAVCSFTVFKGNPRRSVRINNSAITKFTILEKTFTQIACVLMEFLAHAFKFFYWAILTFIAYFQLL